MPPTRTPPKVSQRALARKAIAAEGTAALGVQVAAQIGTEWRAFAHMNLWQRLVWLLTGRGPHLKVSQQVSEESQHE